MIFFYNLWIAVTAVTALSALVAGIYFWKQKERLWRFIALVMFGLFVEAAVSGLLLSIGAQCQVTNFGVILARLAIRVFQASAVIGLKLYLYGYFQRKRNSKDYPAQEGEQQ